MQCSELGEDWARGDIISRGRHPGRASTVGPNGRTSGVWTVLDTAHSCGDCNKRHPWHSTALSSSHLSSYSLSYSICRAAIYPLIYFSLIHSYSPLNHHHPTTATSPSSSSMPSSSRAAPEPRCPLKELCTIRTPAGIYPPQATEIVSRLYIADLYTATNPTHLRQLRATHIVSVMPGEIDLPSWNPSCHLQLSVEDMPFFEVVPYLQRAVVWITRALASHPEARVVVHCFQGISRSSTVVAAYLIASRGLSVKEALAYLKSRRPIADPNFGFVAQLQEFADTLKR
jgi:atypical dual specificity phosphatase